MIFFSKGKKMSWKFPQNVWEVSLKEIYSCILEIDSFLLPSRFLVSHLFFHILPCYIIPFCLFSIIFCWLQKHLSRTDYETSVAFSKYILDSYSLLNSIIGFKLQNLSSRVERIFKDKKYISEIMNKQLIHGPQSKRSSREGRGIPLGWPIIINYMKEMDSDGLWGMEKSGLMECGGK